MYTTQQLLELCNQIRCEFGGEFFETNVFFISEDSSSTVTSYFDFVDPVLNNSGKEIKMYSGVWIFFRDFEDYEWFEKTLKKSHITKNLRPMLYNGGPFQNHDAVLAAFSFN